MLSADRIIRQNSGGIASTTASGTITVSLAGGETTAAGNTVVALLFVPGTTTLAAAGWARDANSAARTTRYTRGPTEGLADGESSWNFTLSGTGTFSLPAVWTVFEVEGAATTADGLYDTSVFSADTSGSTAQLLSGLTSTYDGAVVCVHSVYDSTTTTAPTWSGHTNGFGEVREQAQAGSATSVDMSVSLLSAQTLGSYGADATVTRTLDATNFAGLHTFTLNAAGARKAANLYFVEGAEHGVATNNTSTANLILSMTAGVSVSSTAARSGGFGWLLSSTSAACNYVASYGAIFTLIGTTPIMRRCFRFPTLPAADTDMWSLVNSGATCTLRYITASQQLGLKIGTGAEVLSDATITADQWFGVDLRYLFGSATHTADWMVDYDAGLADTTPSVAQTQATFTGSAGTSITTHRVGWTGLLTATMHTDDAVGAKEIGHYPLGDVRVLPLKVDPAGTLTVSGTTTNFGVMTDNGTVAAWNATNARNAIDDVPPDLSATRDAVVAVAAHATDYVEIPAEPLDMAAQQVNVRGGRVVVCMWAASATTATIRLTATDGVSTFTPYVEQDPNADNTNPVWAVLPLRQVSGRPDFTQARVDALALRMGSNDATPDIGVDSLVFELAVVKAQVEALFGEAGETVYVVAHRDPDSQALVGATVTNNSGAAIELAWEVDGVPDSSGSIPDLTADLYVPLSADGSIETVGRVSVIPG